jgi:hypothetical protein
LFNVFFIILVAPTFQHFSKILVGKPEGKRPLERPRRRWEDGIRMDLEEVGWGVRIGINGFRIRTGGGLL